MKPARRSRLREPHWHQAKQEAPAIDEGLCILAIGTGGKALPGLVQHVAVVEVGAADLTPSLLARLRPAAAACPLLGPGFDAAHIAERLGLLGFRGELRVLCPDLPMPHLVREELAATAPGLRVVLAAADG
jgi:hypothetical protein